MLKNEREREILQLLKDGNGYMSVRELCAALYASESSIRRDLTVLESKGEIKRTHGGAELKLHFSNVAEFHRRTHDHASAKREIAAKAATLIKEGMVVFLDQSSTSFYLACELMNKTSLTIVTNNVEILGLMASSRHCVLGSGGYLSAENRNCLQGADAHRIFEQMRADILFFSTKALTADGTLLDCTREEILVRRAMLEHARQRVFLCDSSKFDGNASYKQCTLADVDVLISEGNAAERFGNDFPSLTIK